MLRNTRIYVMMLLIVAGLSNCKKKPNGNNGTQTANLQTQHLKLLHTQQGRADGTLKSMDVKEMSATSDGRLHILYYETNSFGPAILFRRTLSATGDSLATPSIHNDVLTIAGENDVNNNWRFVPYTDKLTLSYHPASSYVYKLYVVDDMSQTYQFTDASFGALPFPCSNGDKLASGGYEQYFSNSTFYQSQHFFTWNHGGVDYKGVYTHTIPNTAEDMQRRAFAAEPIDDNTLGICYVDGTRIYIQGYNRISGTIQTIDSLATNILQPLSRISVADASMKVRTSRDGQKLIFLVKYLSGAFPGDGMNKYATFIYDKTTHKLSKVTAGVTLPVTVSVNYDDQGNLLYAQTDDQADSYAWGIYKVSADGVAVQIAHLSGKTPTYAFVSQVTEFNGKIYVCVSQSSKPTSTAGPLSYLLVVE